MSKPLLLFNKSDIFFVKSVVSMISVSEECFCIIRSSTKNQKVMEFCFRKDLDGSGTEDRMESRENLK